VNGSIEVIDGSTNTLVASIKDPFSPLGISIDTISGNIYVVNAGANMIDVIDPKTNEVITTISLPVGSVPQGIAFDPHNRNFYVANDGTNTVGVINSSTNKLINTVPVGSSPSFIAFNSANNDVYVSSITSITPRLLNCRQI
jgi:YVTN family beta-propeller protein